MAYIEKEKAQIFLRTECLAKYPSSFANGLLAAADQLIKLPTADVAPKSEVAREIVEIINARIDNICARTPYGGRAQGKTLSLEKMRLLETLKVEIVKKYTEKRE